MVCIGVNATSAAKLTMAGDWSVGVVVVEAWAF